jgi:hypothetical protein
MVTIPMERLRLTQRQRLGMTLRREDPKVTPGPQNSPRSLIATPPRKFACDFQNGSSFFLIGFQKGGH